MKRLSSLLFAMLFVLGCSTEQKEQPETEYVTVNLDFSPNYEIQPLVKSSIGDNDYVVLQVDLLTDNDPYAGVQQRLGGFYTNKGDIKFNLVRNGYYLIRAYLMKDMVGKFTSGYGFSPSKVNCLYADCPTGAGTMMINGKRCDYFPVDSYIGGIFFQATDDITIELNMIHNAYGVTVNLTGDKSGTLYVASCLGGIAGIKDNEYAFYETAPEETTRFMYLGDIFGTIDWLTTGDRLTYESASSSVDIHLKYIASDKETYYLPTITIPNVQRGQNIILDIDTDDFLPASGSIDLNVVGSGELEDVHYKN